jgi:hemolysin activation/secretion protein
MGARQQHLASSPPLEVLDVARRLLGGLLLASLACTAAHAQLPPPIDPRIRSGEPPLLRTDEPRPPVPPSQILPPVPPAPPQQLEPLPGVRVLVREIRVVGSTIFSAKELARVTAPYVGREVTAEDLEALRLTLTRLYVDRGYISSGAILPDQTVAEGVITYQIVEGGLQGVTIEGNRWFRSSYFTRRFSLAGGPPLNVNELQQRLQTFLEDPRIQRLNAELRPGPRPGEAFLDVRVEERFPFHLWLSFDNYQPPSIGAERGLITLEHENLTGNGDVLTLRYGRSEGVDPLLDFRYALPFTARDTTASFQYRRNTFTVIEEAFRELEIESKSEIFTLGLRQPVYRTPSTEIALELIGERLSQQSSLLGEPFSLSPGAQQGESTVTAIRSVQEFVHRSQHQVIAGRSRFSVGVDALGATVNHEKDVPDGRFFAWLGQFQWVRRLPPLLDTQLIFRADLQLTPDALLTLEQLPIGGRYSVRGYRENTLVRDNAFLTSLEARVPVIRGVAWADYVQLAPFVDYGRGWNTKLPTEKPGDLPSVGIGLRWALSLQQPFPLRPQLEVYWGYPLRDVETAGKNLQDAGVHLQFVIGAF